MPGDLALKRRLPRFIDDRQPATDYRLRKVKLENGKVVKQDPRIMLSCSAVAKGYSVDVIARLLDRKGIKNYMVDIGGEVVVKVKMRQEICGVSELTSRTTTH